MILFNNLIWTEGLYILLISIIIAIVAYYIKPFLFFIVLLFILFCFYFFRNPDRVCKEALSDSTIIISPADGKIVDLQVSDTDEFEGFSQKVSIFLSPFDVHVNWIPISGIITQILYKQGQFVMAFVPKSSEVNERNSIVITDEKGRTILVRQIAGTIARRIVCWLKPNQQVKLGEKYGMIRFGSRVDILLPKSVNIDVKVGDRVYGGQTVLGRWLC